jgi:hypothetical protein
MALFRVDFSGRGELSERQQKVTYLRIFSRRAVLTSPLAACSGTAFGCRCDVVTNTGADALQVV